MLSEVSQTEKDKYCILTCTLNLKKLMNITKQKLTQRTNCLIKEIIPLRFYFSYDSYFFNWSIVVSFKCRAKWFSCTYMCINIYSFFLFFFFSHFVITEYWVEFPVLYSRFLLVVLNKAVYTCQSQTPNLYLPITLSSQPQYS